MLKGGVQGITGWQATRWGTKPLTHLEGVRDFLRQDTVEDDNIDRDMNLLAHYGPQNLDEAWMYFKHWVKRRPVTTVCLQKPGLDEIDPANPRMNGTGPSNWLDNQPGYQGPTYAPNTLDRTRNDPFYGPKKRTYPNSLAGFVTQNPPQYPNIASMGSYQIAWMGTNRSYPLRQQCPET